MHTKPSLFFEGVREWNNEFLSLFPHRFDYIYAKHPLPGESPDWQTESRHPLSDRLIQQGGYLYGVRFGSQTSYCLIDIDVGSLYHPSRDSFAIVRMLTALEPIGLVSYIACTSSYSAGIHIYFPFQEPQSSWELASIVAVLLENAGFSLKPGQLEVFPNPKPYIVDGSPSLFNAHRLPLQAGSYLLNGDFQPTWSTQDRFVQQWKFAQQRNAADTKTIKRILKQARRKQYCISGKADKFINDLNAEIEVGWTNYGQTNRLLGRITMRAYIFGHILSDGTPLEGEALVETVVNTAQSLPGYEEWCRHQHEIKQRAEEWVRCIEKSHYFHYGDPKGKYKLKEDSVVDPAITDLPSWNQKQSAAARERIRQAIADLLDKESLPSGATARFHALVGYGIGGGSLYRHRDLWHPQYLVENPPHPPTTLMTAQSDRVEGTSDWGSPPSLLSISGGDNPSSLHSDDRSTSIAPIPGGNSPSGDASADHSSCDQPVVHTQAQYTQPPLFDIKAWLQANQEAMIQAQEQVQRICNEAYLHKQIAQMQQFLESGDPILMAEAIGWAQINPGLLDLDQLNIPSAAQNFVSPSGSTGSRKTLNPVIYETSPDPYAVEQNLKKHPINSLTLDPANELSDALSATGDLTEVLAAISLHLKRLTWTAQHIKEHLTVLFGKPHRALLNESELRQWQVWLEQQP